MKCFFIILISLFFLNSYAQTDNIGKIKYTPDYEFKEGIFISFEQVKLNKPVNISRIVSDIDHNSFNFFKELVEKEKIYFFDDFGIKQEVETKKLWGYSRSGTLYINYNREFNRIPVVGNISHFIADVTVLRERMPDPFHYNRYYSPINSTYETREMRQYLLDFSSGKIYRYDIQGVEVLLMRDIELYDEFNQLKKRKKKKMLFFYIRKFNDNNPLYLFKYQ